ncbi:protein BCCIP homolog [Macrosteles quadrilineatus]|uniref:protein BCCIP homolog n=1 Tax=Macrosteles quadrilineatus TaxID=74068 RepID=UPI0023E1695C|nr:protein BCCIP homolog [Macrosteles quadrilineatus]
MSAPIKKRALHIEGNASEEGSSSDEVSDTEDVQEYTGQEEIQVEFEGRSPIDSDFHGIKQLLHQLFLKAHINLSELTDLIISQNYVGSVVKQSDVDEESDDEDDDNSANEVFGITTVVNLTDKQNLECVQQLRQLLVDLCREHGTDQSNAVVSSLLSNDARPVGLLINERFINIPAQISVPLLESLSKEMKKAKEKNLAFDFTYFIVICKLYKMDTESTKKKKSGKNKPPVTQENEVLWSNPEEELFDQEADCRFEFCVKGETDSGLSGQWLEDDTAMTPYRRILILNASKLDQLIQRVKEYVTG